MLLTGRQNNGSAMTRKCNQALRAAGLANVKVKSSGYIQGGTVSGPVADLIVAQAVLAAVVEVSPLSTYSWGSQFYIQAKAA